MNFNSLWLHIFRLVTFYFMSSFAFSQISTESLTPMTAQTDKKDVCVFVIHSYSQEYPWTRSQHQGFMETLKADSSHIYDVSVEYLDTKRIAYSDHYAKQTANYWRRKYAGYKPAVIYVSDDNALSFALAHAENIFPGVPIFFSGINNYAIKTQLNPTRITGIFENKEIAPNLALMREMAKGKQNIVVVADAVITDAVVTDVVITDVVVMTVSESSL